MLGLGQQGSGQDNCFHSSHWMKREREREEEGFSMAPVRKHNYGSKIYPPSSVVPYVYSPWHSKCMLKQGGNHVFLEAVGGVCFRFLLSTLCGKSQRTAGKRPKGRGGKEKKSKSRNPLMAFVGGFDVGRKRERRGRRGDSKVSTLLLKRGATKRGFFFLRSCV